MLRSLSRLSFAVAALCALTGCVRATLAWTDLAPKKGEEARPDLLGGLEGEPAAAKAQAWRERRAALRAALQREVYGFLPDASATRVLDRRIVNQSAFGGRAALEEYRLAVVATYNGAAVESKGADEAAGFIMDVAFPANASGPAPVILMETFCPRWDTLPDAGVSGAPDKPEEPPGFVTFLFGRYICTPPVDAILDAGYAVATIFPGELVPDDKDEGPPQLRRLSAGHADASTRWGAVAAWGWAFSRMVDALEDDPRIDADAIVVWGHSRYGKSALVAAAFDDRIDGVIAHQSGTGGASLNRNKRGETVKAITKTYPHWFSETYAAYAGREDEMEIDQHALLALIAPRPVLLGNARRDVWSDPNGAFRAAMGADPVYERLGSDGLDQDRLDVWRPEADIAFWMRPGTHGVVEEDWPAFLEFLAAHFSPAAGGG